MAYSKQNFQDGQILTAANLEKMENGIIAGQGAHNLLDNSDFRIAQAGYGGMYGTQKYACYRWYDSYGYGTFSFDESQGLTIAYGTNHAYLVQKINNASQYHNKTMTVALQLSDGTTYVNSGTYLSSEISFRISTSNWLCDLRPDRIELVVTSGSVTIKWIALYEGSYDVNTLPPYVPKDKHVEMLNCNVPLAPHNLLDNSDFTNPVNQRGQSSYSGTGGKVYTIDRWHTWSASISVSVQSGYLSITNSTDSIYQNISQIIAEHNLTDKAATIAVWDAAGNVYCASGVMSTNNNEITCNTPTDFWFSAILEDDNTIYFAIRPRGAKTAKIKAAALYEGSYDASTLPAYQPKGYAAELAECMRYYVHCGEASWMTGMFKTGEGLIVEIPTANNIRIPNPTIIVNSPKVFTTNGWYDITYASCSVTKCWTKLLFNWPEEANQYLTNGGAHIITGIVGVSADL